MEESTFIGKNSNLRNLRTSSWKVSVILTDFNHNWRISTNFPASDIMKIRLAIIKPFLTYKRMTGPINNRRFSGFRWRLKIKFLPHGEPTALPTQKSIT
jgi:hypothetical protein